MAFEQLVTEAAMKKKEDSKKDKTKAKDKSKAGTGFSVDGGGETTQTSEKNP